MRWTGCFEYCSIVEYCGVVAREAVEIAVYWENRCKFRASEALEMQQLLAREQGLTHEWVMKFRVSWSIMNEYIEAADFVTCFWYGSCVRNLGLPYHSKQLKWVVFAATFGFKDDSDRSTRQVPCRSRSGRSTSHPNSLPSSERRMAFETWNVLEQLEGVGTHGLFRIWHDFNDVKLGLQKVLYGDIKYNQ